MSTFVIFAIVLTLGYILYYAAMITIDLTTKQKSEKDTEETITAGGDADEDDFVPRSVIENTETGGFCFSSPAPEESETVEEIEEAQEEEPLSETEDVADTDNEAEDVSEVTDEDATTEELAPEILEDVPSESTPEQEDEADDEHSADESTQPEVEEPIPGVEYYVEKEKEEKVDDDFDVNDAFDPDLMTPKFGITEMVEPSVSGEVHEKAATVNASLLSIESKGNQMSGFDLSRVIREHRAEQHNIETNDEVNNF